MGPGRRQTLKSSENPVVEEALYSWFLQERRRHTPISGDMLSMKAKFFYSEITSKTDFSASKGWLHRFKSRYGIRLMKITGEKLSNDDSCVETFRKNFLEKVKDLCPSQVYNADESGLLWRVLPNKTFVSRQETSVPERKVSKERVTFLPCSNASGLHRLKMVVIGKSQNPRAFKNVDIPVNYYGQKSSWMTKGLFNNWFHKCFVPEVRTWLKSHNLPQKAILLLDNAPCHSCVDELTSDYKLITAMFLPPNCTALIQPMDQNVIQCIKLHYKKSILMIAVSKDNSIEKSLKELNFKDLVFSLSESWHSVPKSTIIASWKNL